MNKMSNSLSVPPVEETLPPGNYVVVTWDLETTDRHIDDYICQIGAYCPWYQPFNQYVLPMKNVDPEASSKIHLQVVFVGGQRVLINTVTRRILDTTDERTALLRFYEWLRQIAEVACKWSVSQYGNREERGAAVGSIPKKRPCSVVLVSHSGIKLDIPVLLQALSRHCLTDMFFEVVSGFGDSFAPFAMELRSQFSSLSLQSLYTALVGGEITKEHDAAADAEAVYRVLEAAFGGPLSVNIPQVGRYCYTYPAMAYYVEWKRSLNEKAKGMRAVVAHVRDFRQAGKIKSDLLTLGYDYPTLCLKWNNLGESRFSEELLSQLEYSKKNGATSYLTHMSELPPPVVVREVVQHFKKWGRNWGHRSN
ncbi:hypothetical protein J437_LFUL008548 [Ladona fulva]|uniref:Exuperantia RNAse H-like domain-containing protein n=1 Tax=Ladona fulva TaxID=123851 RepID=A0A8K0K7M9_LADFU|nr:hypothetical protein J437_LFUL008548 [Ladona fulva]